MKKKAYGPEQISIDHNAEGKVIVRRRGGRSTKVIPDPKTTYNRKQEKRINEDDQD